MKLTKDELSLVLDEGEGHKIEFKESFTKNISQEMVAFANTTGGRIFVGISDDGVLKGVEVTNRLKSQIQNFADSCEPAVKIIMTEFENILVVEVWEGTDKPYKCSSGFYTRVGPNSQKMKRDEIIEFFKVEGKIRFDELMNTSRFDFEEHYDPKKLDRFLKLAGISRVMDDPSVLVNLGVAEKQEGKVFFNNTGILFFSRNLDDIYRHTVVTCALYKGTDKVDVMDRRDFNEDIVSNIDRAMIFLRQYVPLRYEMTGDVRRREIPEVPYGALREAIINAVAHRDYFQKGANIMVEMFDDRIEVSSPGGLVRGLKPGDFGTKSVLRNSNIAGMLHRIDYIEKMGTGIKRMQDEMAAAKLRPVEFTFTDLFVTAIFRRPARKDAYVTGIRGMDDKRIDEIAKEIVNESMDEAKADRLITKMTKKRCDRFKLVLSYLMRNDSITRPIFESICKVSQPTAERDIVLLRRLELITLMGARRGGRYVLTEKCKKIIKKKSLHTDRWNDRIQTDGMTASRPME